MDKETLRKINNYMLTMTDGFIHDKTHVYRVTNQAISIAKEYSEVNMDVLIASCLLHDIGRIIQGKSNKVCHAVEGANRAYDFLKQLGWSEEYCVHVKDCIISHRYKTETSPKTIEAKILFDSDKLDMTGAIGISRVLLYKGYMNQPVYGDDCEDSFLEEYRDRLLKVYDVFYTEQARKIAFERKKLTEIFYEQIIHNEEMNGTKMIFRSIT